MKIYSKTDTGMVREINEDAIYISKDEDVNLYIICLLYTSDAADEQ